ncbi:MAG: hydantoinase/oxoprolinase family protein [Megasphaera sp.]|jgi:N-methylhydantoinase A/oxoprolinase/acetone carboxylase beta subunit|nr:hydantoinase/oxoprolinase family protein [Megasphaera sp.]MCH4188188.1 hydantoinase/oxoprolinase family protein [Megasphaera sp.]MCH4217910.1 hydantoinase/oxoprolinase family protein [Megasphaera sp.]
MKKIMGIDTGGTYTDLVIVSADTKKVLAKYKTLTTKGDLCECIATGFAHMPKQLLAGVFMVCLSTTLATNAIVENHGCKDGLILIGERPRGRLSSSKVAVVKGKFDIKGRLKEALDPAEVDRVIESFRGEVDALAVSGYASVRNPHHEMYVKRIAEEKLGIPVACAHELTSSLGFYDRTVTADLNAKLIPMICELIDTVKDVMTQYQMNAPLMVVKGDGSLMTEVSARNKPIDTILSGPASSVIGGVHLSGKKDAFIIDMGGTTTDIANITGGRPSIRNDGAKVGNWFTHVRATEIFTVGLGGDSRIYVDSHGRICIGPEKSIPVSLAVALHPSLGYEIDFMYEEKKYKHFRFHDHEAYQLIKRYDNLAYNEEEKVLINVLRNEPHTLDYLENHIPINKLHHLLDGLTAKGVIARISLTPTDILHATGEYALWNPDAAKILLSIITDVLGMSHDEFIQAVKEAFVRKLDTAAIAAALYFDHQDIDMTPGGTDDYFLNSLFFDKKSTVLQASYTLPKKIIGIGAPASAWISQMGKSLQARVIIPEHAEVANAVGAAVGRDVETMEILIRPDSVTSQFVVYSPRARVPKATLEEATIYAIQIGNAYIKEMSPHCIYQLHHEQEDLTFEDKQTHRRIFMERLVRITVNFHRCRKGTPFQANAVLTTWKKGE